MKKNNDGIELMRAGLPEKARPYFDDFVLRAGDLNNFTNEKMEESHIFDAPKTVRLNAKFCKDGALAGVTVGTEVYISGQYGRAYICEAKQALENAV